MAETLPHLKEMKQCWYQNVTGGLLFSLTLSDIGLKLETVSCYLCALSQVPTDFARHRGGCFSQVVGGNGSDRHAR